MSPAEVQHVQLRRSLFGYRRRDVDAALERVASAFAEVWRERTEIEERNHAQADELGRHQEAEAALRRTLITAERQSDVLRADARRDAERITREAEQRARELIGEAQHERERTLHATLRLQDQEREFRARLRSLLDTTGRIVAEHERDVAPAQPAASAAPLVAAGVQPPELAKHS